MLDFIDIYSFIPMSGGVGMITSPLLCPGAYNVVKTDLDVISACHGYSDFLHQWKWSPRYNWNIVESGVKHHNPNPLQKDYFESLLEYDLIYPRSRKARFNCK